MQTLLMITHVEWYGSVLTTLGVVLLLLRAKRRFYRRGPGGLQHAETFSGSIVKRTGDLFLKLVGIASLLAGLFLICIEHYNNHQ